MSIINDLESDNKIVSSEDNIYWKCTQCTINKGMTKFFVQVFISLSILGLSIYKLIVLEEGEDKSLYISLMTLILGIYTPQPNIK